MRALLVVVLLSTLAFAQKPKQSIPIRFELIMQGTAQVEVCQDPGKDWYPTSTNNLW